MPTIRHGPVAMRFAMDSYRFQAGETPVLLSIPHGGTRIPPELAARMTEAGKAIPDTDWHLDRLYDFAAALGVGILAADFSRYVIDLNRNPDGTALYRGADNTELCPTTTFERLPIYRDGEAPDRREIEERIRTYWRPYHDRLETELKALKARFGIAVLFDAHSIRSRVPRFFEGRLPDFNLGTADGASAPSHLSGRLMNVLSSSDRYGAILDGRFKGGYITRHYGRPAERIHAVQLELAQVTYMEEEPPFGYRPEAAAEVRPILERFVTTLVDWAWNNAEGRHRPATA
jgi:N-formylglutamate deformylase